jgi:hypothetical protein
MVSVTRNFERPIFEVIHPLFDQPEEKRRPDGLGPMAMTRSVKLSLFALRGYLIVMALMVGYRLLTFAGVCGHLAHL